MSPGSRPDTTLIKINLYIDFRVSVVSLEIPGIVVGRISVFYRKTGNFHRKNDREKISEIFVHLAPENTGKNEVSQKSCSKNSFSFITSRFQRKLRFLQSFIILNLRK